MAKKYIHYCWFGGKPLPKLAKKCIKSWKKYLPDYEIIKWSEENVDLNECPFVKEAYENKKWAFVADYVRTKAMYEYGGIYFDTDMEITKNIDFLLEKESFLGVEDSNLIACGVWGEKNPKSYLATEMLKFYKSQERFKTEDLYELSIPRIISNILDDFNSDDKNIQILKHNIYIYPREYFYPLSYDHQNNIFTENTCMIHYYDASWVPKWEQRENKIFRIFGKKRGQKLIDLIRICKKIIKKIVKISFYPLILYVRYRKKITPEYLNNVQTLINKLNNNKNLEYVVFHPKWMGITNATKELFENPILSYDLIRKKDVKKIGKIIIENNYKQLIYSGMCDGWDKLAIYIKKKNPSIKIKTYWHGSHSQILEPFGWKMNQQIFDLHKDGIIDVMGTCKQSLMKFYENQGYKAHFITNKVEFENDYEKEKKKNDKIRIGLYAAISTEPKKNMFTQIAAVALMDNVVLDMVPLNDEAIRIAKIFGVEIDGLDKPLSREKLFERMSNNDINLYVTLSECAPMLPLESFEVGVPCITGNNHHYFINEELEEYLVVNNETSPREIMEKIKKCLENKDTVLKLYAKWKEKNIRDSKNDVLNFLKR